MYLSHKKYNEIFVCLCFQPVTSLHRRRLFFFFLLIFWKQVEIKDGRLPLFLQHSRPLTAQFCWFSLCLFVIFVSGFLLFGYLFLSPLWFCFHLISLHLCRGLPLGLVPSVFIRVHMSSVWWLSSILCTWSSHHILLAFIIEMFSASLAGCSMWNVRV